jgi:hypothetical protein
MTRDDPDNLALVGKLGMRVHRLGAENKALREALERIAAVPCQYACKSVPGVSPCLSCIARTALAREEGKG